MEPVGVGPERVRDDTWRDLRRPAWLRLPAYAYLRRGRHVSEPPDRVPGRLLRLPARRTLARAAPVAHHRAVLDQLPHAHARVGEPALHGRLRQPGPYVRGHPRCAEGVAGRQALHRYPGSRLRLRAVPDPAP